MFASASHDESDDLSQVPRLSLEKFYSTVADIKLSDVEAQEMMSFSARMAMVRFKDNAEMMSFKVDFQAALAFIQKLDEIDVSRRCLSR